MADPTNEEQLALELINRFRVDPGGEFARYVTSENPNVFSDSDIGSAINFFGVDLAALKSQLAALNPASPFAWNSQLNDSAETHSQLMISFNQQSHDLPGEPGLIARMTSAGYVGNNFAENIFLNGDSVFAVHGGFIIDWGFDGTDFDSSGVRIANWQSSGDGIQDPAGHRDSLIDPTYKEIGISIVTGTTQSNGDPRFVTTHHLGGRNDYDPQIVGVVIKDADGDQFYDIGEGLGGITVTASNSSGSYSTTTWASGGYQLTAPAGTYTVTFSIASGDVTKQVTVGSDNVKVDAISLDSVTGGTGGGGTPTSDILIDLFGTSASETLAGGSCRDRITAFGGDDVVYGSGGDDVLLGQEGNDRLEGEAGVDLIFGGTGNDVIITGPGDANNVRSDRAFGESGNDLIFGGDNFDILLGESGDDRLGGGGANDDLFGGAGADSLQGEAGNDRLFGEDGEDLLFGQAGDDIIQGEGDNDRLFAGTGADLLFGQIGDDELQGEQGNDRLFGGFGKDIMFGQDGDDEMQGEQGNDRLFGGNGSDIMFGQDGDDELQGEQGNDRLFGGNGNDILFGQDGNDELQGEAGDDRLFGGNGNDTLLAGSGSGLDQLFGEDGNDTLVGKASGTTDFFGAAGNDVMYGGAGKDVYVFNAGFGADTVKQFQEGAGSADVLSFSSSLYATAQDVKNALVQVDANTFTITHSSGNSVTIDTVSNTNTAAFTLDDFSVF